MPVRTFAEEYSRSEFGPYESPPYLSPITCNEAVTFTALVKFGTEEDQYIWTQIEGSGDDNYCWGLEDGRLAMRSKGVVAKAASYIVPRNKWLLVTYTKGSGTVKPKFYIWDYETEELTVVEGSLALENCLDDGGRWAIGNSTELESGERFTGAIAAHAIWEEELSESTILTGLVEVEFLEEWQTVKRSGMRGLWYWNQFGSADDNLDRSEAKNVWHGGVNGGVLEEEPPIPYQAATPPVNIVPPTVFEEEGQLFAVNYFITVGTSGEWSGLPTGYEYIWERSEDGGETWAPVSRSNPEYEFSEEDEGFLIRCNFFALNSYGKSTGYPVGEYGPIEPAETVGVPVNTVAPVLGGDPKVGEAIEVNDGTWTGADGHFYGWYVSTTGDPGTWIAISTGGSVHVLEEVDEGFYVRARVGAYKEETPGLASAYSNVIGPVGPAEEEPPDGSPVNTVLPVVTGTPDLGETLESSTGTWENEPESYEYQWEESATGVGGWSVIGGETAATLLVGEAFAGFYLRCRVTAINEAGSKQAASVAVGPVPGGEEPPEESPVGVVIDGVLTSVQRYVLVGGDLVQV